MSQIDERIVTRALCDIRHKEVEDLKSTVDGLRNKIDIVRDGLDSKLNKIYTVVLAMLLTMLAQLVLKILHV